jgi:hypothetical protein
MDVLGLGRATTVAKWPTGGSQAARGSQPKAARSPVAPRKPPWRPTRGRLTEEVGQAAQTASGGAFALQVQPAGGYQLVLGSRAALAAAAHQALDPAQADEGAAGALVGEGGQQRVVVSFSGKRGDTRLLRGSGCPSELRIRFQKISKFELNNAC